MEESTVREWQFDGLVGPSHNYAGLSLGNVASEIHKHSESNPRAAALQGLHKMRHAMRITGAQSFFLPHYRPVVSELKRLGWGGSPSQLLASVVAEAPEILACVFSASAMWAANAATVAPSMDTNDHKLHLTPANLISKYHRSLEPSFTLRQLRRIFADEKHFTVHDPLPSSMRFSDEGAANHMRIAPEHGAEGFHVFVYGCNESNGLRPQRYPARQHEEACRAIARMHRLDLDKCLFVQQNPEAIDAGIFHHDVVGLNSLTFLAQHESAWVEGKKALEMIADKLQSNSLRLLEIGERELKLSEAVSTYFFNSQLLSGPKGIEIIAPMECAENAHTKALYDQWEAKGYIHRTHYLDVRESMKNGGGPACLRLRVVMTDEEAGAMHQGIVLTEAKADALEAWIKRHYRDRLSFDDLRDPGLITEIEEALDALTQIVGMEGIYPFQVG